MEWDYGGLYSFLISLFILAVWLFFKRPKDIKASFREKLDTLDTLSGFTMLILAGVGLIAFWLSVRVALLYFLRYLTENYNYNPNEIFDMIAYALATNLCFTLSKSIPMKGKEPTEELEKFKRIVYATMQAILIGIILLLPRYNDRDLLQRFGGSFGFVSLLLGMAIAFMILMFASRKTKE